MAASRCTTGSCDLKDWSHGGNAGFILITCLSGFHSKLVINQIIAEDDAIYQCQAENHLGSVLSMARLIVVMSEDRPSAPRNIQADTVSSSAILLAWERPLYNSEKVIAYSVHYMKAEGEFSNGKNGSAHRNAIPLLLILKREAQDQFDYIL